VFAIDAETAALEFPLGCHTQLLALNLRVVLASIRVIEALAGLANVRVFSGARFPRQLIVERKTFATGRAMRVVSAFAKIAIRRGLVGVAALGVPIADTLTPDRNVADGVEVATSDRMVEFLAAGQPIDDD